MPSFTSNFKRTASAAAVVLPKAAANRKHTRRSSSGICAPDPAVALARYHRSRCADRRWRGVCMGTLLSIDRLWSHAQR